MLNYCCEKSISPGCTPKALASLRMVRKYGFCLPPSIWLTVSLPNPAFWASLPWVRNCLSRNSFKLGILLIFYHNATERPAFLLIGDPFSKVTMRHIVPFDKSKIRYVILTKSLFNPSNSLGMITEA